MSRWSFDGRWVVALSALALVHCAHAPPRAATTAASAAPPNEDARDGLIKKQGEAQALVDARTQVLESATKALADAQTALGEVKKVDPKDPKQRAVNIATARKALAEKSLQYAEAQKALADANFATFQARLAAGKAIADAQDAHDIVSQWTDYLTNEQRLGRADLDGPKSLAQARQAAQQRDQARDAAVLAQGKASEAAREARRTAIESANEAHLATETLKTLTSEQSTDAEKSGDATLMGAARIDSELTDSSVNQAKSDQQVAAGAETSAPKTTATQGTPAQQTEVEFATGGRVTYGLNISLFEFNVKRPDDEPGRLRDYRPNFVIVPPQLGFQFTYEPPGNPWRLKKKDGSDFQLMSVGGMVLVQVDNRSLAQGAISVGGTLGFFANVIGIGLAVDLYRGIPTQDANGGAGGATADTGFLAWAFSPHGEVTPEDVSLVLTFGLQPIVDALSGVLK